MDVNNEGFFEPLAQKPVAIVDGDAHNIYVRLLSEGMALKPDTKLYTTPPQPKEPEQEPVAMKFKIYKPTVPDPMRQDINDALLPWVYDQSRGSGFVASMWVTPVATLSPQRTWVGLTKIEADKIYKDGSTFGEMMRMVEAKLKEKNT